MILLKALTLKFLENKCLVDYRNRRRCCLLVTIFFFLPPLLSVALPRFPCLFVFVCQPIISFYLNIKRRRGKKKRNPFQLSPESRTMNLILLALIFFFSFFFFSFITTSRYNGSRSFFSFSSHTFFFFSSWFRISRDSFWMSTVFFSFSASPSSPPPFEVDSKRKERKKRKTFKAALFEWDPRFFRRVELCHSPFKSFSLFFFFSFYFWTLFLLICWYDVPLCTEPLFS
eukprot:TRINITY_DN2080_c0_g3_i1.p1 TRINITY_DN2080_c0_g3~~TRINITY_DN2080_c0_g3_i1.p1  ORF type:complete len:229 (+),score=-9.56 TRINITY_DN2080_c0_g3_i1:368-1054(+)